MRVLGIDPGIATLGYGVAEGERSFARITHGVVRTRSGLADAPRLLALADRIQAIIAEYRPDRVAVERLFFKRNSGSALPVGQARGVVLFLAARAGLEVDEWTPAEVKEAVCGYGAADKEQVVRMVTTILNLKGRPRPDDAADALAVALTSLERVPFLARVSS